MSLRTLFRRTAVPVAAAVILGAVAAVPAEAAVGTVAKPTLYQATVASPGIKVSWKAVSRATSYQVQYSTSSAFRGAVTKSPGKVTSYVVKGLTPKKKYYFRVRAKTTASVGRWSLAVAKTRQTNKLLGTPTGYAVVGDGADLIVKWVRPKSSNTDTPISYRLALGDYRQVDDKILTDPEDGRTRYYRSGSLRTSSAAPKLRVKGAPALTLNGFGRAVYVQILSQNSDGSWKSDGGKAATRTAFGVVPADPDTTAGITATAGCTNVVVRWNKGIPANATGLEARVYDAVGALVTTVRGNAVSESVNVPGLKAGSSYLVEARATNADKSSVGWSNRVAVATASACAAAIKVGTYNIVKNDIAGVPSWSSRRARVAQMIKDSGAAVVGLQETRFGDKCDPADQQLNQLLSSLGGTWRSENNGRNVDGCNRVGKINAFRAGVHLVYDTTKVAPVDGLVAKGVNPDGQTDKEYAVGQVFQTLDAAPTKFVAVTLHTDSTLGSSYTQAQKEAYWKMQAGKALGLAAELRSDAGLPATAPTLMVGDFNLQRSEWNDTPVRAGLGAQLTDARSWNPAVPFTRLNSQNDFQQCGHAGEVGVNVDGIFSQGRASATGWKMMLPGDGSFAQGCYDEVPPSDHNMLVGTFVLGS